MPLLTTLLACALHADKIPDHELFSDDDRSLVSTSDELSFAVVGNVRGRVPGLDRLGGGVPDAGAPGRTVAALTDMANRREIGFAAVMGDCVRWGSDVEWRAFDAAFTNTFAGQTQPDAEGYRIPVLPVVGDREIAFDKDLVGMEGAYPGYGADIGYNRVASWSAFDVQVGEGTWRFLVLDSNKKRLGSRWREQINWIPKAVRGRYDHLLVFMHHARVTLAQHGDDMNPEGVPRELVEAVEQHAPILKLKAVFSGDSHTSEFYLPEGRLGVGYVNAGGGGAPAQEFDRWGNGEPAAFEGLTSVQLEARFDLALQQLVARRAESESWPRSVLDKAQAMGEWDGFAGAYDPAWLPTYGLWTVTLDGRDLRLGWVELLGDGTREERFTTGWVDGEGWR